MSYTLGQLTDDTFAQLRGSMREQVNLLAASIDAPAALSVETLTFSQPINGMVIGALLTIGTETMKITDTTPSAKQATVIRGYEDTTPATAGIGALVIVDPPWTRSVVQARIRDEIRSWAPQLYAIKSVEIPIVEWQRGYDLSLITTPIIRILHVTAPQPPYTGFPGAWEVPALPNEPATSDVSQANPSLPFEYQANANPSEFPSGKAIILNGPVLPQVSGNLHVVYATSFDVDTSWGDSTDMLTGVGMNEMDLDIPPLGAAARLIRMLMVRRGMLNVQGQNRDDQDVTMQALAMAAAQFEQAAQSRRGDAQQRLLSDFPFTSTNF